MGSAGVGHSYMEYHDVSKDILVTVDFEVKATMKLPIKTES